MLPPGPRRLVANPEPTGSPTPVWIGIVRVANWSARVAGVPRVRIASTPDRAIVVASSVKRCGSFSA